MMGAMTYVTHADLGGKLGHGPVVDEPEGERSTRRGNRGRSRSSWRSGATGSLEHRHGPPLPRDAARLRRLELLPDLDRGARATADRARARRSPTNSSAGRCADRRPCPSRAVLARRRRGGVGTGSPTAGRRRRAGALRCRRPGAHARRARADTTPGCPATRPGRRRHASSACTACTCSLTPTRRASARSAMAVHGRLRRAASCGATPRARPDASPSMRGSRTWHRLHRGDAT